MSSDSFIVLGDSPDEAAHLLGRLPVALYRTSTDGRVLAANQAFADLIGATSVTELATLNVRSLYPDPSVREHMIDRMDRGINVIGPEDIQIRRLDGKLIWIRISTLGTYTEDGIIRFYEGALEDVTARRELESASVRNAALLEVLSRAQQRYITGEADPFQELLGDVINLTNSASGLIARVDPTQATGVRVLAVIESGAEGSDDVLESDPTLAAMVSAALARRTPMIDNSAGTSHHSIESYLALPIVRSGTAIGVIGVANRPGGYADELVEYLEPLITSVAGLLEALNASEARQFAERQRQAADRRFRAVIEAANDAVIVYGTDGVITAANPAVWQVFGCAPQDLIGRDILTLVAAEDALRHRSVILGENEMAGAIEVELSAISGGDLSAEMSIGVSRSPGVETLVTAVIRDISARKSNEMALLMAKEAAELVSKAKDQFLATMSHELRTPLNAVIGLSSILARSIHGPINEKQSQYLAQIESSGRHLLDLINDVLDLAKIEADRLDPEFTVTDICEVTREAVAMIRESAVSAGIRLEVSCESDLPEIIVDGRRIKQVMVNLLSNAVKFTPSGGRVGIVVERLGDSISVEVWDTGIGIPADRLEDVFLPFQQVDSTLSRSNEGTGLGLTLSRQLVEAHGGTLTAESTLGRGSRFRFTLPLERSSSEVGEPGRPGEQSRPEPDSIQATVLVADDNDLNRMMISDYLIAVGMGVLEARDGIEAVDMAIHHRPDAILMDVQMPRRDGLEATRELKSRSDTAHIPVVALTALAMRGDAERCRAAGCDEYLAKPVDPAAVVEILGRLLARV